MGDDCVRLRPDVEHCPLARPALNSSGYGAGESANLLQGRKQKLRLGRYGPVRNLQRSVTPVAADRGVFS